MKRYFALTAITILALTSDCMRPAKLVTEYWLISNKWVVPADKGKFQGVHFGDTAVLFIEDDASVLPETFYIKYGYGTYYVDNLHAISRVMSIRKHPRKEYHAYKKKISKGRYAILTYLKVPGSDPYDGTAKPKSQYSPTPSRYGGSDSRTIHTGPRGGRYYINKNGNKTYIKK